MTDKDCFEYEGVRYFKFGYSRFGKPALFVYVYYIDGLLIDTGQPNMRKHILGTLSDLPVDQVFITHHHEDHTGNIDAVQRQFNCPVYASSRCCEIMKAPPPPSLPQILVWGRRPAYADLLPLDNELRTTNHAFELIPVPGHAEDMVVLYEPDRKWLFSADLFVHTRVGYVLKNERILVQIKSIKKVLELNFEVLFCSHNPQLTNGREKLSQKLDFLEEFSEKVIPLHTKGYSPEAIVKRLKLKEYHWIRFLSLGQLSKVNMVRSVMRDYENER